MKHILCLLGRHDFRVIEQHGTKTLLRVESTETGRIIEQRWIDGVQTITICTRNCGEGEVDFRTLTPIDLPPKTKATFWQGPMAA